jgi:hypothetical protein
MRWAYAVTTYSGAKLVETIHSVPKGARLLVVDNSQHGHCLSSGWNYAIERLLGEGFDAVVVMNDDIVLRADSGENLARALLKEQFEHPERRPGPEALLVTCRHANHGDMYTDEVNQALLDAAAPRWQPGPDFSCFCVGQRLLEVVGRFDENFSPAYFEDNDMHRRIQLAGFEGYAVTPYWHYRSVSYRTDPSWRAQLEGGGFDNAKRYYCAKWGAPYAPGINPIGKEAFTVPFNRAEAAV